MIDVKLLKELFMYDDGKLFWKISTGFPRQHAGFEIKDHNKPHGYKRVTVNGKRYKVHQIIFMMHHGYLPPLIEHIDKDKLNNRIENLRPLEWPEHSIKSFVKKNESKVRNVNFRKDRNKYQVKMNVDNKRMHFGFYDTLEEAKKVAEEMRQKHQGTL